MASTEPGGFTDVRFCEKSGDDVGASWYWNRYPGIACDVESYSYFPVARGDGLRALDEVRIGLRDPRVLPEPGAEVRLLRPLPVPHDGAVNDVGRASGRWIVGTDRGDKMRARSRDPGQRHPDDAEAGAHRGYGKVQGPAVPHLALGLQTSIYAGSASASSGPARPRCRQCRSQPRSSGIFMCSSAHR